MNTDLPETPSGFHQADAQRFITESSLPNEWDQKERLIFATQAQATAMLALVEEQRTANLLNHIHVSIYAQIVQLDHNVTLGPDIHDQNDVIATRLGLK